MAHSKTHSSWYTSLSRFFASRGFFYGLVIFFVLNALWFALVSLYPMAFDEEFHVGVIKLYAESWHPFGITQTPAQDVFGSIATDPSYLFHYLMSFPYRFFSLFTSHEQTIIVLLRIINVAFATVSLFLYRKVLLAARVSPAVTHVVLAVFVLIPVLPMMAGQVNYDNLLLVVVAALLYYAMQVRDSLVNTRTLPLRTTLYVVLLVLFGSVVKYAYLPIALGVFFVLLFELIRAIRHKGSLFQTWKKELQRAGKPLAALLVVLLLTAVALVSQRYVVNVVQYGSPVPDCGMVLDEERCQAFGPWGRDYRHRNSTEGRAVVSMPEFVKNYMAYGMWHRLYFTLAGPTNSYSTRKHLPTPSITAVVIVVVATAAVLYTARSLFQKHPWFWLFLVASLTYIAVLTWTLYASYTETTRANALNGRYLLPLLPLLGGIGATAIVYSMQKLRVARFAGILAVVFLLLLLQGGGALTYMYYAESAWLWQHPIAQGAQNIAQPLAQFFIIGK